MGIFVRFRLLFVSAHQNVSYPDDIPKKHIEEVFEFTCLILKDFIIGCKTSHCSRASVRCKMFFGFPEVYSCAFIYRFNTFLEVEKFGFQKCILKGQVLFFVNSELMGSERFFKRFQASRILASVDKDLSSSVKYGSECLSTCLVEIVSFDAC